MNLDLVLARKLIVTAGALASARDLGFTPDMLMDAGRGAFEFAEKFTRDHGQSPTLDTVEKHMGLSLEDGPEPLSYYVAEAAKRWKMNRLGDALKASMEPLKASDPEAAARTLVAAAVQVLSLGTVASGLLDAGDERVKAKRVADYLKTKTLGGAIDGVPTPWATINEATRGMHEDELWVLLGRMKSGKSWAAILMALQAWAGGQRKVLLVSEEMGIWKILRRWDAVRSRLPYSDFVRGQLDTLSEDRWFADMGALGTADQKRFLVAGRTRVVSVADLELLAQEERPEVIFVDGAYFLEAGNNAKSKWDRTSAVVDQLQAMVQRRRIPTLVTWQFNRAGGKKGAGGDGKDAAGSEEIAFAFEVAMNADVVLGLYRDDEIAGLNQAILRLVEHREGRKVDPITVNYNLMTMDFSEVQTSPGGAVAAAPSANAAPGGQDQPLPF